MQQERRPQREPFPAVPPPAPGRRSRSELAALDDAALVALLVAQDVRALEVLYERYSRPIFSLGLKILGSHDAVEEVVQEVFMRLWTRAAGYDATRGKLLSWLLTITHHRAVDELRRRRTRPESSDLQEALSDAPDTDPSRSLDQVALRLAVQRALAALPPPQRQPIEMAYFGGMTQLEISQALSVPLGTIKTRTRLGLLKLRGLIDAPSDGGSLLGASEGSQASQISPLSPAPRSCGQPEITVV